MNTTIDFDRYDRIRPIRWTGEALELLDQRKLPFVVEYVTCNDSDDVAEAIHALTVRGAPAIGIAAAWGVVLAARDVDAADGAEAAPSSSRPCSGSMPRAPPRSTWPGRWRACAACWPRPVPTGATCSSAKRRRSPMRTSPPTAAWAHWARR